MIEVPDNVRISDKYKERQMNVLKIPNLCNRTKGRKRGLSVNWQVHLYQNFQFKSDLTKIDEYEEAADEFGVLDTQKPSIIKKFGSDSKTHHCSLKFVPDYEEKNNQSLFVSSDDLDIKRSKFSIKIESWGDEEI